MPKNLPAGKKCSLALFGLLIAALLLLAFAIAFRDAAPREDGLAVSGSRSLQLSCVAVYGEHALLYAAVKQAGLGPASLWLKEINLHCQNRAGEGEAAADSGGETQQLSLICGEAINQGLCLWQLAPGLYSFDYQGQPLTVADFAPLEGYTILRQGARKHWRFSAGEPGGLLQLSIAETAELPAQYCDIYLDAGHGGTDSGALAFGRVEAEENRKAALYFAEQLRALGFVVMVSPFGEQVAESGDNPYLPGARIDSIYRSGAAYLISNHLNGGDGGKSGFQIYTSVKADNAWAEQVAASFTQAGWHANNGNWGRVGEGMYKRWSRDNYHSGRDYYFILRETGGYALSPYRYRILNQEMVDALRRGPEGMLLEYLFLDNANDLAYWDGHYRELVDAAVDGCLAYWQAP